MPGFPPSMRSQLNSYLGSTHGVADPNALYVVAGGSNNIRVVVEQITPGTDLAALSAATSAAYASDIAGQVHDLMQAGARHVLVLNTPNYGLTPWMANIGKSAEATSLSAAMDAALKTELAGSGAITFDMFSYLTNIIAAGPAAGFSDLTHACGAELNACDPATSLFWDGVHPTTLAHQKLAAAVLATAVPEPDVYAMLALGLVVVALGTRRRAGVQQR
jgi:outer membrane lipase/esterase